MFFSFAKKVQYPTGVDIRNDRIMVAQLQRRDEHIELLGAGCEKLPADIQPGSVDWQKWAIKSLKQIYVQSALKGRKVITALPYEDVYVDQVRIPKSGSGQIDEAIINRIRATLPYDPQQAIIQHIITSEQPDQAGMIDVIVMAMERLKVERHLAIYEKAGLEPQSITVWPTAVVSSFVAFFARRRSDIETVAALLNVSENHSHIVICKHSTILFARTVGIGFGTDRDSATNEKLVNEVEACLRYIRNSHSNINVSRLLLLSNKHRGELLGKSICTVAEKEQMSAQLGDVVGSVNIVGENIGGFDRRGNEMDWTVAFGLSLSQAITR